MKIRKCEAFRDSVKLLGTNGIFQRKLLSLKASHYCINHFLITAQQLRELNEVNNNKILDEQMFKWPIERGRSLVICTLLHLSVYQKTYQRVFQKTSKFSY